MPGASQASVIVDALGLLTAPCTINKSLPTLNQPLPFQHVIVCECGLQAAKRGYPFQLPGVVTSIKRGANERDKYSKTSVRGSKAARGQGAGAM